MLSIPPLKAPIAGPLARPIPRPLNIDPSCVLYYSLIDPPARGKVLDESPEKNNGIINGPTWTPDGLKFNGVDNFVSTPSIAMNLTTNAFTFVATVKPVNNPDHTQNLVIGWFPKIGFTIKEQVSGKYKIQLWLNGIGSVTTPYDFSSYRSLVGVYTGKGSDEHLIYLDGELIQTLNEGTPADLTNTVRLGYDQRWTAYSTALKGTIAEAAIFNRAFSAAEVKNMAEQSLAMVGV